MITLQIVCRYLCLCPNFQERQQYHCISLHNVKKNAHFIESDVRN